MSAQVAPSDADDLLVEVPARDRRAPPGRVGLDGDAALGLGEPAGTVPPEAMSDHGGTTGTVLQALRAAAHGGLVPDAEVERWIVGLQRRTGAAFTALWVVAEHGLTRCAVAGEDATSSTIALNEDSTLVEPVQLENELLGYVALVSPSAECRPDEVRRALHETATAVSNELALRRARRDAQRARELVVSHAAVQDLIARAAPLPEVLRAVTEGIERHDPTLLVTIVLLDASTGTMHPGAGPSLPESYLEAIDGVVIGPNVGACGTAAWSGELVISDDIATDPRWAMIRHIPAEAGLASCWSMPIKAPGGDVLGTLAFYGRSPRRPLPEHLILLQDWARVVGIALERHRATEQLFHDARHDSLTGLPNRIAVMEALEDAARHACPEVPSAVLFVDIDGLKRLNDTFGHDRADQVLREIGARLSRHMPDGCLVGRLGGDEFLVVAEGFDRAAAEILAAGLLEAIAKPLPVADDHVVTASIGVALADDRDVDAVTLLREADRAMYAAKRSGRDRVAFFSGGKGVRSSRRISLRHEVRSAVVQGEVSVAYEPMVDLATCRVVGVEAVPQWQSPSVGEVSARELWRIAEEVNSAAQMGAQVLREGCDAVAAVSEQLGRACRLGTDISVRQLEHEGFAHAVHQVLIHSGCRPDQLCLELDEADLARLGSAALDVVHDLAGAGVHIGLDHAGGALGAPALLERVPVSVVKLGSRLTQALPEDSRAQAVAAAVVSVARAYGCLVGAQGIDAEDQRACCADIGVDVGQGRLWAGAASVDDLPFVLAVTSVPPREPGPSNGVTRVPPIPSPGR